MSYQAPVILLVTVGFIILTHCWLCRHQKVTGINYPCLVLVIGDQDNFLEGLLRHFFLWCYWKNDCWRLQVIVEQPSAVTFTILRHFFAPYSCYKIVEKGQKISLDPLYLVGGSETVHYLDIRGEKSFKTALNRLRNVYHKNDS